MVELKCLNKRELETFIHSKEFENLKFLPITKHRALSHINNPRADENDTLLILAYKENELLGYLGVLADLIYFSATDSDKCGWLSCMWLDESSRGLGISKLLVKKAFETWNDRILVTEFTVAAKGLYDSTKNFNDLQINTGIRLYLRLDLQTILPPKKNFFKNNVWLLRTADSLGNFFLDWRLKFRQPEIAALKVEHIGSVDDETANFISEKQPEQIFKRGAHELNWLLKYPWIISGEDKDNLRERYHFSAIDRSFDFHCLKIRNRENQMIAFLIFAKRNQSLKLPYCYFLPAHLNDVLRVIDFHLLQWRISTFTVFHPEIVRHYQKEKTFALYKKETKRHYIISKVFEKRLLPKKYEIQDGDADCAFT